jgi:hypothetical protein
MGDVIFPVIVRSLPCMMSRVTFVFTMTPRPSHQGMISSFFGVLIDLIIGFLGLIIKAFDNQTEIWA